MNDADIVGMLQAAQISMAISIVVLPIELLSSFDASLQRFTLDQLHRVEELTFLFAKADQPHDAFVTKSLQRLDFLVESAAKSNLVGDMGRDQLDRNRLLGRFMNRTIDGPHPAATEGFANPVGSQKLKRWHRRLNQEGETLDSVRRVRTWNQPLPF